MIILTTIWYPLNRGIDLAKLYLKLPREIPNVTKWRVFNTAGGLDGYKQYHLFYTEKGKGEEAILEISKFFMPIVNEIEGLRLQNEILMGITDTYNMIGMKFE